MTSPIPDGIELGCRNHAVAELNIQALSWHVVLVEALQIVAASNHTPSCLEIEQATFDLDGDFAPLILYNEVLILPLLLVRLENRFDENIANLTICHTVVGNQDTGRSDASSVRCQVVAVHNTKMLSQAGAQHIQAGDPTLGTAAVLGQHGAGGSLVHLYINNGRGSTESLELPTHNDVRHRNLFLLGHRHGRSERTINAVISALPRLLGSNEPGIFVASCDQNEIIQANTVDAQRAFIGMTITELQAFRKLLLGHAFTPVGNNHAD